MSDCNLENILEETRAGIASSGLTLHQVAEGAGLTYHWLAKFNQGQIPNPGIRNVAKLRDFLITANYINSIKGDNSNEAA